ncbi:MAG: AraC family transcriptional regulator [Reichenbachiella sp.]|uniref:helix-turn-helix domain-containing protein n=2 Tax=Reichenbachiella sp. TaxID=2184521 RepID=UPI00326683E1
MALMLSFLIAFGACQAFFISLVLLSGKDKTSFRRFFAWFLIIEGITLFERLLVGSGLIDAVPHLIGISYPISFLKPPLLLFMAFVLVNGQFKLRKVHYLHFIPFVILLVFNLPFYAMAPDAKLDMVRAFMNKVPSYQSFDFYLSLSFFFHIGIYMYMAIRVLREFKTLVKNNALVNWYLTVLFSYSYFLLAHFIYFIFSPLGWMKFPTFNQISMLIMTFIIQSIAYKLINRSSVFNSKRKPELSDLDKYKQTEQRIKNKFETDKIHLDDTLNLEAFAQSVGESTSYVSELINQRFGCSFKNLLAQYRLEEAKTLMRNTRMDEIRLIDIAYGSGFNNKVSFYRTFKSQTGYSPSEYLREIKNGTLTKKSGYKILR